jgi:hypothetical protein
MLRYAICTTPLCTGAEGEGEANLGVPSTLMPSLGTLDVPVVLPVPAAFAPAVVAAVVAVVAVMVVVEELGLEDPQALTSARAQPVRISDDKRLGIGMLSLA